MRFSILRSGSSGNCTYIEHENTRILLDAGGMSRRKITELIGEIGVLPESISAVITTHLHCDHLSKATLSFCKTFSVPLWINERNETAFCSIYPQKVQLGLDLKFFGAEQFIVGDLCFEPFLVPHDAAGVTNGFRFFVRDQREESLVGYATDLGRAPEEVVQNLTDVTILCIEANHDPELLWGNDRRTWSHKKRVTGGRGHLSNQQSREAILSIIESSCKPPQRVILCHLSADHNTTELAMEQVGSVVSGDVSGIELVTAHRHQRTPFFTFNSTEANSPCQLSFLDQIA